MSHICRKKLNQKIVTRCWRNTFYINQTWCRFHPFWSLFIRHTLSHFVDNTINHVSNVHQILLYHTVPNSVAPSYQINDVIIRLRHSDQLLMTTKSYQCDVISVNMVSFHRDVDFGWSYYRSALLFFTSWHFDDVCYFTYVIISHCPDSHIR